MITKSGWTTSPANMHIGLYFGSFNPIHIGHLLVADTVAHDAHLDKVWFVISPRSPFKVDQELLHHFDRLDMVRLAIADNDKLGTTDIEFSLPQPNYTIDTLDALKAKYPQHRFSLVMGEDNLASLHKWKDAERIVTEYKVIVYPRPGTKEGPLSQHPSVQHVYAPLMDVSATYIRKRLQAGLPVGYLVPESVQQYMRLKKLF